MASTLIKPSVLPGQALPQQVLTFTFDPQVEQVLITQGNNIPVFSKTLGYDIGPIPGEGENVERPFLAVTQDGRGNVVYDAGYVKYIDDHNVYPPDVTFDGVKGGIKFLINAMKWASNRGMVNTGNNKMLILGNCANGEDYDIIQPQVGPEIASARTLKLAAKLAGFEPTLKNLTSYGGSKLNPTVEELAQYSVVVLVSMAGAGDIRINPRITENGISALHYNRKIGTGIVMLTDHCLEWYTSLEDAHSRISGFPVTAQAVSAAFGTWFTGMVNRANITVGELIATSGPSPLFDNIPLDEGIGASVSESLVMVVERTGVPPDQVAPINMNRDGEWLINVLVINTDGSAAYETYRYFIIASGDTNIVDRRGVVILNNQYFNLSRLFQMGIASANPAYQDMRGIVTKNSVYMGSWVFNLGTTTFSWPSGAAGSFLYEPGDVIEFHVEQPFLYNLRVTIERPTWAAPTQPASQLKAMRGDFGPPTGMGGYNLASDAAWQYFKQPEDPAVKPFWMPKQNALIERLYTGQLSPAVMTTYATYADFQASPPTTGVGEGYGVVIRDTMAVWIWRNSVAEWTTLTGQPLQLKEAALLLGVGRRLRDARTNVMYRIEADKIIPT
jgi:hypothetical protein